jgi:transitional endoplasmic reticulum ATPase
LVYPSRGNFLNPSTPERRAYACFWQNKLASNKKSDVSFPDTALDAFAQGTDGFSFAYLID